MYKMPALRRRPAYRKKMPAYKRRAAAKKAMYRKRYPKRSNTVARYVTQAGSMTNSLFTYGKGRKISARVKAMRRVGAPDVIMWNGGFQCGSSQGKQAFYGFNSLNQNHVKAILSIVGGQAAPNQALIENAISELSLTNITNTSAEVEIYDIVFKRDVPNAISWVNNSITYTVSTGEVPDMIAQGVNAASGAPSIADNSDTVGISPYDSQVFKAYCKVVKRTHVMLGSGATHRHQSLVNVSKVALQTVAGQDGIELTKGYAFCTLIKVNGAPAYIPTGEYSTLGTPSDITLQAVYTLRVKYTYVQDVTSNLVINDAVGDTLDSPAATTRNPGSGALEPISP